MVWCAEHPLCSCKGFLWLLLLCSVMACALCALRQGWEQVVSVYMHVHRSSSQPPVQECYLGYALVTVLVLWSKIAHKQQHQGLFALRVRGDSLPCGGRQGAKCGFSCDGRSLGWLVIQVHSQEADKDDSWYSAFYSARTPAHGMVSSTFREGFLSLLKTSLEMSLKTCSRCVSLIPQFTRMILISILCLV